MMGGETAWNMYSIDSNKEYCITLHLVGCTQKNALSASLLGLISCEFHKLMFCGFVRSCYWVFQIILIYSFTSSDDINIKQLFIFLFLYRLGL
jgi:hypothetical protein